MILINILQFILVTFGVFIFDYMYYFLIGGLITRIFEGKYDIIKNDAFNYAIEQKTKGNIVIYIFMSLIYQGILGNIYFDISDYSLLWIIHSCVIYLLLADMFFFTFHYLSHSNYLYKKIHKYHHKFNPTTLWAVRASHYIDSNIENMAFVIPFLITPIYFPISIILSLFTYFWSMIIHSEKKYDHGIKYLYSNKLHAIHHNYGKNGYNYSFFFTHWDILFNTLKE